MSKWETVKLKDIGEGCIGLTYAPADVSDAGIIVLRSGNIQDGKLDFSDVVRVNKKVSGKLRIKNGDILICSRNGSSKLVGKSALITDLVEEITFGAFMMIYRSEYNPFLIHFFHSCFFRRQLSKSATTTINQITKRMLDEIEVPFPPLETQKQIAKTLDTVAELLAMRKKQLAELDNLIKSIFYYMFGGYIKDKNSFKPLPDICRFIDYRGKTPKKSDSGVPLITAKNVKNNIFSIEPQEFIPATTYDAVMTRGFPKINDVIFTTEAPLGNVCRIPNIFDKFAVGQRIIIMQPFENIVISEYLEFALASNGFQTEMLKRSSGSTVKGIRSKELAQLSLPVPPFLLQIQFAEIVTKIEEQKALVQKAIDETQYLFDSLMSGYFEQE